MAVRMRTAWQRARDKSTAKGNMYQRTLDQLESDKRREVAEANGLRTHPITQHQLNGGTIVGLAKRVGCSDAFLRQVAIGKKGLSLELANRLAAELGCRIEDLVPRGPLLTLKVAKVRVPHVKKAAKPNRYRYKCNSCGKPCTSRRNTCAGCSFHLFQDTPEKRRAMFLSRLEKVKAGGLCRVMWQSVQRKRRVLAEAENPDLVAELARLRSERMRTPRSAVRTNKAFVYLIKCSLTGYTKIGVASDPLSRLKSHQVGCPQKLEMAAVVEGDETLESQLHRAFGDKWVRGEWFALTDQDIRAVISGTVQPVAIVGHRTLRDVSRVAQRKEARRAQLAARTPRSRIAVVERGSNCLEHVRHWSAEKLANGWTDQEVAWVVGVTAATVSRWRSALGLACSWRRSSWPDLCARIGWPKDLDPPVALRAIHARRLQNSSKEIFVGEIGRAHV